MKRQWQTLREFMGDWRRVFMWLILVVGEGVAVGGALSNAAWSGLVAAGVLFAYALIAPFFGELPLFGQSAQYKRRKEATRFLNPSLDIRKINIDLTGTGLAEEWNMYTTKKEQAWETLHKPDTTIDEIAAANAVIDGRPEHPGIIGELAKFMVIETYAISGENALRSRPSSSSQVEIIFLATYLGTTVTHETLKVICEAICHYQEMLIFHISEPSHVYAYGRENPLSKLQIVPPVTKPHHLREHQK